MKKFFSQQVLAIFFFLPTAIYASGFQLFEENASSLGNAYAGTAAVAEDASTAFYNPAGLTLLHSPEMVVVGTLLDLHINADINSATANSLVGLAVDLPPFSVLGRGTVAAGSRNFVPALHLAFPCYHRVAFALSVTAPFGLNTDYPNDSLCKYLAKLSKLTVIDVSPSVALQINRYFSMGAGVDIQYAKSILTQKIPVGESLPPIPFGGPFSDGDFFNQLNNVGYGWNAGLMYEFTCRTRVGLDYHSQVHHRFEGIAKLELPLPLLSVSGDVEAGVTFPDSINLSFYHDITRKWALLGSIVYTHWSVIDVINLNYSGAITSAIESTDLPIVFKDTYRYALGANYSPTEKWKLRTGLAYDETPVRNVNTRTFRLPDSDRYWFSLGVQYHFSSCLALDLGYSYVWAMGSSSHQIKTTTLANSSVLLTDVQADFHNYIHDIGAQLTWKL